MEIWKDIEEYKGIYMVSDCGNVKRVKSGRILQKKKRAGYRSVVLCKSSVLKDFYVHRLVASAFLPNPEGKATVNHKDGNKLNNTVENLE